MRTLETLLLGALGYLSRPHDLAGRLARLDVLNEIRNPPEGWRYVDPLTAAQARGIRVDWAYLRSLGYEGLLRERHLLGERDRP